MKNKYNQYTDNSILIKKAITILRLKNRNIRSGNKFAVSENSSFAEITRNRQTEKCLKNGSGTNKMRPEKSARKANRKLKAGNNITDVYVLFRNYNPYSSVSSQRHICILKEGCPDRPKTVCSFCKGNSAGDFR